MPCRKGKTHTHTPYYTIGTKKQDWNGPEQWGLVVTNDAEEWDRDQSR